MKGPVGPMLLSYRVEGEGQQQDTTQTDTVKGVNLCSASTHINTHIYTHTLTFFVGVQRERGCAYARRGKGGREGGRIGLAPV